MGHVTRADARARKLCYPDIPVLSVFSTDQKSMVPNNIVFFISSPLQVQPLPVGLHRKA